MTWLLGVVAASLLAWAPAGFAQPHKSGVSVNGPVSAKASASGPSWAELTPSQQKALAPLASNWNTISEPQKRKWLEISKNYSSLPPEGQATLNSRMNEWVTLSPQQRAQARLNFGKTKELARQLTPEEKNAKWQAYQALSPEEKQKLAAKASPKPSGAATAVKPVAPQKLTKVPSHANKAEPGTAPKMPLAPPAAATSPTAPPAGETATGGISAPAKR